VAFKNSFTKIAVNGQDTVKGDAHTDTLTLAAGSNVTLTTDASTDTVTIAASGSGGGGASALNDLSDATVSNAASAQILVHDGSNSFDNVSVSGDASIATNGALTLGTVAVTKGGTGLTSITSGHVLYASGTNTIAAAAPGGTSGVQGYHANLAQVAGAGNGTDGHVLTSNGSGTIAWEAVSGGGGSSESNVTSTLTYDDDAFDLGTETYTANDTVISALAVAANKTITGVSFEIPAAWTLNSGTASGEMQIKIGDVWYKPQFYAESYGYLSASGYWLKNHSTGIYGFVASRQSSTGSGAAVTVKVKGVTNDTANGMSGYLTAGSIKVTIYYT